jgi:hypothetical protein
MFKHIVTDKDIRYDGDQLTSLFNYRISKEVGDSIVAFKGEMDVTQDHMVDIEDVINNDYIYSPRSVNFIIELFDITLEATVLYQRAFMQIIANTLKMYRFTDAATIPYTVELDGDDIFITTDKTPRAKMSVSIATVSKISGLIHTGINIDLNSKVPVLASCLSDLFAEEQHNMFISIVCSEFCSFVEDIKRCKYKVLGV